MRKLMVLASVVVLLGVVAICTSSAAAPALHPTNGTTAVSFASLTARHCSPNEHLCDDCNGGTVCVKNGVMCPVCGPF